ncbi:MAG: pyruvate, phosphate dikinase, partial [Gammaproteobacteria bacterium]|nr:pyruvate, phosphate dikinase [Gammaproteobacteria bacterium]
EIQHVKRTADRLVKTLEAESGKKLNYKFGTMIETVRACTRAWHLADIAEFFSFGTNDLTQATFSFSREDAENKFLPMYNEMGVLQDNPFEVLDTKGVGKLIKMAVTSGREQREDLKIGICGEQGGHPDSIQFCHDVGLNYVSCSGPRVPVARLAAAQAKLKS